MFKKTGSPVKVNEVIAFDLNKSVETMCQKCGAYIGLKCGSSFKPVGKKALIPSKGWSQECPKCGWPQNV